MRTGVMYVSFAASALTLAGCSSAQVGPVRPITIAEQVAYARPLAEPNLSTFYTLPVLQQAVLRNEIVTARMYLADVEYHYYEARLTREMQEEGLGATLASLGLTTASTLVTPAETKTILSGLATAVIGADKAYNEKQLLSNTIQALQTQMRADRKTEAAVIYGKMYTGNTRIPTPIYEYTLPMALSDAESYYQAGTIASALIGLSKTVANADQNADQAKCLHGPNPDQVCVAKSIAAPNFSIPPVVSMPPVVSLPPVVSRPPVVVSRPPIVSRPPKVSTPPNDPLQACQQLPDNATSTQRAICNFIGKSQTNITNATGALQGALAILKSKLPSDIGLAGVISGIGEDFENVRKQMLQDPVMKSSSN